MLPQDSLSFLPRMILDGEQQTAAAVHCHPGNMLQCFIKKITGPEKESQQDAANCLNIPRNHPKCSIMIVVCRWQIKLLLRTGP